MSQSHFIVYERDASWQFTHKGSITAPFDNRDEAIEAAIGAARDSGDPGAVVIVQDRDTDEKIVWRHDGDSAEPNDQP
ncbi:DUF2188 domain-containing protein [Devosia sp. FJ2-5-3]|jgi:hypothetical protein|uniref:DUF2188 domain-containing protein n=1 Tax=Devosia sp. FJ2-5-3 TaxID=2976680 RepID=UPI0023D82575|nr:DUF2188 domain-containing protein [Devosia sp. FJ2-5-3]WEJ56978.1 DUF2188 domain-containing protein [Devosia sp. FJ2-5-3]